MVLGGLRHSLSGATGGKKQEAGKAVPPLSRGPRPRGGARKNGNVAAKFWKERRKPRRRKKARNGMAEEEIVVPYSGQEHLRLCAARKELVEQGQSGRRVGFICFVQRGSRALVAGRKICRHWTDMTDFICFVQRGPAVVSAR